MRIISQDGRIDLPYEMFVIGKREDNTIVACKDIACKPNEITERLLAEYSTKEKVERAMKMLRTEYENYQGAASRTYYFAFDYPKVFQFPLDSEV